MQRPTIIVFFGGTPSSYNLSRETGQWVCQYIPRSQYQVKPVHVTHNGLWQVPLGYLPQSGNTDLALERLFEAIPALSPAKGLERLAGQPVDAFLTVLRGAGGDDGALHSLGQILNVPVIGSPASTCQQTSHKQSCAQATRYVVTSPHSRIVRPSAPREEVINDIAEEFVFPLFIKPASQEGSIGIEEVMEASDLPAALERAFSHGDVIIQERADGTELSITLVEDAQGQVRQLPPTVIVPQKTSFYDSLAKARPGRVHLHTPSAQEKNPVIMEAQTIARDIYDSLGCRGFAAIDLISGDNGIDLLEVNTIPTLSAATPLFGQLRQGKLHPSAMLEGFIKRTLEEN